MYHLKIKQTKVNQHGTSFMVFIPDKPGQIMVNIISSK